MNLLAMKLKDYISQKNVVLGSTEDGKAWALKALHPADPLTEVRGIPDESAVPSVFQNFQFTTNVVNPTASTAGSWEFDLFLYPNPILVGALRTRDSTGAYQWSPIVNPQVGISTDPWYTRQQVFADTVQRYRVAYLGVTGHLDAAAVTNQGSIVVAQYPQESISGCFDTTAAGGNQIIRLAEVWSEAPKAWDQLITMPNAYVATALEGLYAPYKLGRTHQRWQNARDLVVHIPYSSGAGMTPGQIGIPFAGSAPSLTTATGGFPYGVTGYYTGATVAQVCTLRRADSGVIHVAARNLHYQSAYQFVIRMGYETQVSPASQLGPFAKISPRHDALAVDGYFAVAREFKDAYPEEYNGWEEILGVIGNAVGDVVSALVPGGGMLVKGAKALIPRLFPSLGSTDVTSMSAAQKDDARKLVADSTAKRTVSLRRKIGSKMKKR